MLIIFLTAHLILVVIIEIHPVHDHGLHLVPDHHHHQQHPLQLQDDAAEPKPHRGAAVVLRQTLITRVEENQCIFSFWHPLSNLIKNP